MVSASAVLGRAQHGGTSTAQGDPCDEARTHVLLTVEMEAAVAGTVETTTDTTPHDIQVESTWPAKGSVVLGGGRLLGRRTRRWKLVKDSWDARQVPGFRAVERCRMPLGGQTGARRCSRDKKAAVPVAFTLPEANPDTRENVMVAAPITSLKKRRVEISGPAQEAMDGVHGTGRQMRRRRRVSRLGIGLRSDGRAERGSG